MKGHIAGSGMLGGGVGDDCWAAAGFFYLLNIAIWIEYTNKLIPYEKRTYNTMHVKHIGYDVDMGLTRMSAYPIYINSIDFHCFFT